MSEGHGDSPRARKNVNLQVELSSETATEWVGHEPLTAEEAAEARRTVVMGTVGRCAYCGVAEGRLTKEHVIPLGLGGNVQLLKASCDSCRNKTSWFENEVLHKAWRSVRAAVGMPSRNPDALPTTQTYLLTKDGVESLVEVSLADYIPLIGFPVMRPPGALTGQQTDGVWVADQPRTCQLLAHGTKYDTLLDLARGLGADRISFTQPPMDGVAVARLVAKVAYGFGVGEYGLDAFDEVYVLPAILEGRDIGTWVGMAAEPRFGNTERQLHIVTLDLDLTTGVVESRVKLLARFGGPEYHVIVGRLRPEVGPSQ